MGNKIHLPLEGRSCPTPTLQIKDPPSFLHMFKQGQVWVWFPACFTPEKFPGFPWSYLWFKAMHEESLWNFCHLRYTSAFVGHLLLSGIAAVLLLPLSFWKGESKIFKCVFSGKSRSGFNICTGLYSCCWISLLFLKQFNQQPACWAWQDVGYKICSSSTESSRPGSIEKLLHSDTSNWICIKNTAQSRTNRLSFLEEFVRNWDFWGLYRSFCSDWSELTCPCFSNFPFYRGKTISASRCGKESSLKVNCIIEICASLTSSSKTSSWTKPFHFWSKFQFISMENFKLKIIFPD